MKLPQNVTLWIALAIPVTVVVIVAALIYWPQNAPEAQHDFIYTLRDYNDGYEYVVKDGVLTRQEIRYPSDQAKPVPPPEVTSGQTRFFQHDVNTNESKEISFEEAGDLTLDGNLTAPDGYEITRGGQGGGVFPFFFDGGDYEARYLVYGNHAVKMNIKKSSDTNYQPFEFLGWVIQ